MSGQIGLIRMTPDARATASAELVTLIRQRAELTKAQREAAKEYRENVKSLDETIGALALQLEEQANGDPK